MARAGASHRETTAKRSPRLGRQVTAKRPWARQRREAWAPCWGTGGRGRGAQRAPCRRRSPKPGRGGLPGPPSAPHPVPAGAILGLMGLNVARSRSASRRGCPGNAACRGRRKGAGSRIQTGRGAAYVPRLPSGPSGARSAWCGRGLRERREGWAGEGRAARNRSPLPARPRQQAQKPAAARWLLRRRGLSGCRACWGPGRTGAARPLGVGRPAKPGPASSRQECGFGVTRFAYFSGEAPDFGVKYTAFQVVAKKSNPDEFGFLLRPERSLSAMTAWHPGHTRRKDPCLGWVIWLSARPCDYTGPFVSVQKKGRTSSFRVGPGTVAERPVGSKRGL